MINISRKAYALHRGLAGQPVELSSQLYSILRSHEEGREGWAAGLLILVFDKFNYGATKKEEE